MIAILTPMLLAVIAIIVPALTWWTGKRHTRELDKIEATRVDMQAILTAKDVYESVIKAQTVRINAQADQIAGLEARVTLLEKQLADSRS